LVATLPGPILAPMAAMEQALSQNVSPDCAAFAQVVFSLHDAGELREVAGAAGFREIALRSAVKQLRLPPPADFFWQYVHSTPLAGAVVSLDNERTAALERDVCDRWQPFVQDGALQLELRMSTLTDRK
jgi:hypothetical protein